MTASLMAPIADDPQAVALTELAPLLNAAEVAWQERARCAEVDPEIFYPDKGDSTRPAKRVCAKCEVREPCLQYALDHSERYGIWGGHSERERRRLKPRPAGRPASDSPPSRFRGVTWSPELRKWRARPVIGGERVYLGSFADDEEAARAVAEAEAAHQASQPRRAA